MSNQGSDVMYATNRVKLRFKPRASPLQETPGATHYDLMPTAVTWTAAGHEGDCTISGQVTVNIPSFENQDLNLLPLHPAYGYLNVVGLDGGDFPSVMVSASNPKAVFKKTCPGPQVIDAGNPAAFLLHIISQPNSHVGSSVAFKGTKTIDLDKPTGFLDLLPPGPARDMARKAFGQAPSQGSGTSSSVYTWDWDLQPLTFGQTPGN
jgi:hypothetical protein